MKYNFIYNIKEKLLNQFLRFKDTFLFFYLGSWSISKKEI